MKQTWSRGLVTLAAVAATLPGRPAAQVVIRACYSTPLGIVYRIGTPGAPNTCVRGTVAFSWTDLGAAAGGDLTGTLPNPTVAGLQGRTVSAVAPSAGQVLAWDGLRWSPTTPVTGVTVHGALSGLGADDHKQYLLADGSRAVSQGFAATGGYPTFAPLPASGAGTRLMWAAGKAAFRAGTLSDAHATAWDDANVGVASVALGFDAQASAAFSFACCVGVTASNQFAVALGSSATASGWAATALGNNAVASGDYSTAIGFQANTNGMAGSTVIADAQGGPGVNATAPNSFVVRAQHIWLGTSGDQVVTAGRYLETSPGAYLSDGGAWTNASSRRLKDDFRPVDADSLLDRVAHLAVSSWHYRAEAAPVRHLGPTAEDFRAAFGLGDGDAAIATIDVDGVNMVAIQALARRLEERDREIAGLREQLAVLSRRLERLESAH